LTLGDLFQLGEPDRLGSATDGHLGHLGLFADNPHYVMR